MKKRLVVSISFVSVIALSLGFAKDYKNNKVYAQTNGDQSKLITIEEQNRRESKVVEGTDVKTHITADEQNMVENSSAKQGFVQQENGTGFFFEKK
ncbi:hypothetical protein [Gottfriedia luciferensis]|uniref:hypothetical protein n=1 Tax=Gottfriedia luciferensis TaxID=178774 RepID=UPI000B453004|nr:hypothetical protein [Gottfriedia luciferensis]